MQRKLFNSLFFVNLPVVLFGGGGLPKICKLWDWEIPDVEECLPFRAAAATAALLGFIEATLLPLGLILDLGIVEDNGSFKFIPPPAPPTICEACEDEVGRLLSVTSTPT